MVIIEILVIFYTVTITVFPLLWLTYLVAYELT